MTKKNDSITPNNSFYEELKPDIKILLEVFNKSAKGRAYVIQALDEAAELHKDATELRKFFVDIKKAFLSLEVKTV